MASTDEGRRRPDGAAALGELLRAHADDVADAVLERFAAGRGPDGAPDAATLRNLRLGARAAVDRFLARLAGDGAPLDVELFEAHGRAQQAAGRTLTELLSFYRLGGLATWERSTALAGGVAGRGGVVRCDDHEIALLLGAAPDLAREVARRRLAALDALEDDARLRMTATLAAWLADPGRPQAMADRLGVHVQTVRYRLKALRELLGDALDDPDERFELALALRVTRD